MDAHIKWIDGCFIQCHPSFDKNSHGLKARSFLVFELKDTSKYIIVGSHSDHRNLANDAKLLGLPDKPIGAGRIAGGKISGWKSLEYNLETPPELYAEIKSILQIEEWWPEEEVEGVS